MSFFDLYHQQFQKCQNRLNQELQAIVDGLPGITSSALNLDQDSIQIGQSDDASAEEKEILLAQLKLLKPWRKGPFDLFGITIDSEWRSQLKWDRLRQVLPDLAGKTILDIGCGNGYYLFRMAAHNPRFVLGLDPSARYYYQFLCLQKYAALSSLCFLPMGYEDLEGFENSFDVIFLMGVLYHRKDPVACLKDVKRFLKKGGAFILEGLYMEEQDLVLDKDARYAQMKNVYYLPTLSTLEAWFDKAGFTQAQLVSTCLTTQQEQRPTEWIDGHSLCHFLDPHDYSKTIEGYPAPRRFIYHMRG